MNTVMAGTDGRVPPEQNADAWRRVSLAEVAHGPRAPAPSFVGNLGRDTGALRIERAYKKHGGQ